MGEPKIHKKTKVAIVGCGGMGSNAIQRMVFDSMSMKIHASIDFIAMDSDAEHLLLNKASKKILLGKGALRGSMMARHKRGRTAIYESIDEIKSTLKDYDMVFIIAGMGGGTGSACAPLVGSVAEEMEALSIGMVTIPFEVEDKKIKDTAKNSIQELEESTDILMVFSNDLLLKTHPTSVISDAFADMEQKIEWLITGLANEYAKGFLAHRNEKSGSVEA